MLNEKLYKALAAAFGSVVVDNEGVSAEIVVEQRNGIPTWHLPKGDEPGCHGEQYRINCPYCKGRDGWPDSKHHLYISYLTFAHPNVNGEVLHQGPLYAHCFRCDAMRDPAKREDLAFRIWGGQASVQDGDNSMVVVDMSAGTPDALQQHPTSDAVTVDGVRTWVDSFQLVDEHADPDILEYLAGRGLSWDDIRRFSIGWGPVRTPRTGRLLNGGVPWVIVPVVMNGKLKGIQARCPDKFLTEDDIKYWTHPGMRKSAVVYNLDSARQLSLGVLCEGTFDVFKVGSPGVCIFGHVPSPAQKSLLATVGGGLILLPDTDRHADFDTVQEARALADYWNSVNQFQHGAHVVELSAKDAGAMSRSEIWSEILAQLPDGGMRDHVITNILGKI